MYNSKLFSRMVASIHRCTNSVLMCLIFPRPSNICYFPFLLSFDNCMGVRQNHRITLTCILLINRNLEHFCHMDIASLSFFFWKLLVYTLRPFINWEMALLFLRIWVSSLYTLKMRPLSGKLAIKILPS